jgi:acyl-CoA thioesterase II
MTTPPSPHPAAAPQTPQAALLSILDLTTVGVDTYSGVSLDGGWGRVYGGQVVAQASVAAGRTVDPARTLHSLHAYFLIGGTPSKPITYEVQRLRDGGSFSTRRVVAIQDGQPLFAMSASFHVPEPGLEHATPMPVVPPPEDVSPVHDIYTHPDAKVPPNMRAFYATARPIELKIVEASRYFGRGDRQPAQSMWLRLPTAIGDERALHIALLAYMSDFAMIDTALIPHDKLMFDPGMQLASLDHALWVHRDFRADDWLLFALESPSASGGRGFARGAFYTRDGILVASVAQEGLIRERSTSFVIK